MYTNYTWRGQTFHKGKAYRFTRADAMECLSERDCDRPIWKMFKKPVPKVVQETTEVDATHINDVVEAQPDGVRIDPKRQRIEIGTDEELQAEGILPPADDGGNVTV
jgi:hypothetical protein